MRRGMPPRMFHGGLALAAALMCVVGVAGCQSGNTKNPWQGTSAQLSSDRTLMMSAGQASGLLMAFDAYAAKVRSGGVQGAPSEQQLVAFRQRMTPVLTKADLWNENRQLLLMGMGHAAIPGGAVREMSAAEFYTAFDQQAATLQSEINALASDFADLTAGKR